jgi:hypothetical protein
MLMVSGFLYMYLHCMAAWGFGWLLLMLHCTAQIKDRQLDWQLPGSCCRILGCQVSCSCSMPDNGPRSYSLLHAQTRA